VPAEYHREKGTKQLLAAYDLGQDKMYAHMEDRKTNVEFLAFLKYLRSVYPAFVLLYIILDNASAHTMDRILEYASRNGIEFAFTPTKASWLNPIEPHFGPLRKFAMENFNPANHKEISRNVRRYIAWRNRHHTTPSARKARKISGQVKPRSCGKCGVEVLERH
jgi:hypothetical protein